VSDTHIRADPVDGVNPHTTEAIRYQNQSFFAHNLRNVIEGGGYGIRIAGKGYGYAFHDNHVNARWGDPGVAFETNVDRTIIVGGEYSGRTGIRFKNNNTNKNLKGGLILEPGFENNPQRAVDIGGVGDGAVEGVQMYHTSFTMWLGDESAHGVDTADDPNAIVGLDIPGGEE